MDYDDKLTVEAILERPLFRHARIIAGHEGIRRNVRWVHIVETTHLSPFVNEDDLILTTGVALKSIKIRHIYMNQLIEQKAAGLCVELGEHLTTIPGDMIELADKHHFPLIAFEQPVRFVDITQDLHAWIINKHHHFLQELEQLSRELQKLTLQSTEIKPILQLLHERTKYPVLFYSLVGNSYAIPSSYHTELETYQRLVDGRADVVSSLCELPFDASRKILIQPVICFGNTLSYIALLLPDQPVSDHLPFILDYAIQATAHVLLRKLFLEEKAMETQQQFMEDLLIGNVHQEDAMRARIGLQPTDKQDYYFMAGIMQIVHDLKHENEEVIESVKQDLLVLCRTLLRKQGFHCLLLNKKNQLYILCFKESYSFSAFDFKEKLTKTLHELRQNLSHNFRGNLDLFVGFSQPKTRLIDMHFSFDEADKTLNIGILLPGASPFYDELGVYQILTHISDTRLLKKFVHDHIGPLLKFEDETDIPLLETLSVYFKNMGNKQETAEQLFIHRQTLYHRLEKCKELLGPDFLKPHKRICLELAIYAYHLVDHPLHK
ncbi:PucR family transcriptional regulator [Paenibacillus naphthalenovorans]|uniref:PucR family transcriptional regulator n=1 Tax=Paenibacillus naphthalenovorans TaxID=162209 RepID=UPI003D2CED9F